MSAQKQLVGFTHKGGKYGEGVIYSIDGNGDSYSVNHVFKKQVSGAQPEYADLVLACNKKLYGLTALGGVYDAGVLFEYDPLTNTSTPKIDFSGVKTGIEPRGSLMLASNGKLYGTTPLGGANNGGALFEFDPVTGIFTKKIDFQGATGYGPEGGTLLEYTNGKLYGMTTRGGVSDFGTLFEYDISTNTYTKKIDFDGTNGKYPNGSLILASNGKIYGMTKNGGSANTGALFEYIPSTNTLTRKFNFDGTSGTTPLGSLVEATKGELYGLTYGGGQVGFGVLFEYKLANDSYVRKISFDKNTNGSNPAGSLVADSAGHLYGMTQYGGTENAGVLFEYDPSNNLILTKFVFSRLDGNGYTSKGSLVMASNGKFYGMTHFCQGDVVEPAYRSGAIIEYDPVLKICNKKLAFEGVEAGAGPNGTLLKASNGKYYGITEGGGNYNAGVIFEFNPSTSTCIKLFDFKGGVNGSDPQNTLVEANNGKLYGITDAGGSNNGGVIFEFDPSTNIFTKEIDLIGSNGSLPYANSLIKSTNGKLYGLTNRGGSSSSGTLFEYDPVTNTYTKKIDFTGVLNGKYPSGILLEASNGKLYGVTENGGTSDKGSLFEYDIVSGVLTKTINFSGSLGTVPIGGLIEAANGKLYGVTSGGNGTLFEYVPATKVLTKKKDLDGTPGGILFEATNGKFYGTTKKGGTYGMGTIFEYDPVTDIYLKKHDFNVVDGSSPYYNSLMEMDAIPLSISLQPQNINVCEGNTADFIFNAVGTGVVYQWQDSTTAHTWTDITGENNDVLSISNVTNPMNGNKYRCIVSSFSGSDTTIVSGLTVNPLPVVSCFPIISICENDDPVQLNGCGPINGCYIGKGISNHSIFTPSSSLVGTQVITYMYSDLNGCTNNSTLTINVNSAPVVNFPSMNAVCENDSPFTLTGATPVGGNYSGTGVASGMFSPTVAGIGSHNIIYTLVDTNNCSDTDSTVIVVDICTTIENITLTNNIFIFPNPFTQQTTISFSNELKNATLKIMDVLGKEVRKINFSGKELVIEKEELKSGIYFIQVISENEMIANEKMIIQ